MSKSLDSRRGARVRRPDYDRARDLASVLPLWPEELADQSLAGTACLVGRVRRALREERRRGIAGHWAYDLARHVRLRDAYQAETARLQRLRAALPQTPATSARIDPMETLVLERPPPYMSRTGDSPGRRPL